jgi:cation:H+ antiporter
MDDYVLLTLGMLCAGAGCELLLRGSMGLAAWLRVPPAIARATVGLLVPAGAEIAVVARASWLLRSDLALGAALGTSIVNLGLVLAIGCFSKGGLRAAASVRNCALAVAAPLTVAFFARNGGVSRNEGLALLAFFLCWLLLAVWDASRQAPTEATPEDSLGEQRGWLALSFCFVGLLLLASTGRLIVEAIEGLVISFKLDYFIIGATLVPLCTTVPELTSAVATRYRSGGGISTDRLLANSLLNAWLLGGIAAVIAPFRISATNTLFASSCAALLALLTWPNTRVPSPVRGVALAAVYAVFLLCML